jgi:hypothetical protein
VDLTAPFHAAEERRHLGMGEMESVLPPQAADIHAATSQVQSGDATSEAVAIAREREWDEEGAPSGGSHRTGREARMEES